MTNVSPNECSNTRWNFDLHTDIQLCQDCNDLHLGVLSTDSCGLKPALRRHLTFERSKVVYQFLSIFSQRYFQHVRAKKKWKKKETKKQQEENISANIGRGWGRRGWGIDRRRRRGRQCCPIVGRRRRWRRRWAGRWRRWGRDINDPQLGLTVSSCSLPIRSNV